MPCSFCGNQFTIFKRKRSCASCHFLYCSSCLGKKKKNFCLRCELIFLSSSKRELMELKTKDLIFFLQSRKINFAGIVEKEELCNLILYELRSHAYSSASSPTSSTPNGGDFDANYAHSFDQIKQTCQNIFTSLSDKIASDFQKTTCFNQSAGQNTKPPNVTTQQPRARNSGQYPGTSFAATSSYAPPSSSSATTTTPLFSQQSKPPQQQTQPNPTTSEQAKESTHLLDCECSDEEMDEICEKRQNIIDTDTNKLKKAKLSNSSSMNSSSFEEVNVAKQQSDDDWQIIEPKPQTSSGNDADEANPTGYQPSSQSGASSHIFSSEMFQSSCANHQEKLPLPRRRCSDSSLLNMKKSKSINIDISSFNPGQSSATSEVKAIKVSCKKCGKTKTKIKNEIMKLSEQLKSSNRTEDEINAKIKEFMDYLESKSQPSEVTETDISEASSQPNTNNDNIQTSTPQEEVADNVFDENEGINVYATSSDTETMGSSQQPQQPSSSDPPKRFISLEDIHSSADLEMMSVKQLKEILMLNRVDFKGCCEKNELKERVKRLWESHVSAPPSDRLSSVDLCKICMDAPIECVFLECGHSLGCISCCKVLSECPVCRQFVVRLVRIFKS